jgi:hypothetical protein
MVKAAVEGVNGTHQSFGTLVDAWDAYNTCRELKLLEILD